MNRIEVTDEVYLDQITNKDIPHLITYLGNKKVSDTLLVVPHPYTKEDAQGWVDFVETKRLKYGMLSSWSIYLKDEGLVGGVSLFFKNGKAGKIDEIGYWLGEPFWNRGIMSSVLTKVVEVSFSMRDLDAIEATIFNFNPASGRALEKAGFKFLEHVPNAYEKEGKTIDGKKYQIKKRRD